MIMGLLDGLNVQNGDRVVFVDVIPNRLDLFFLHSAVCVCIVLIAVPRTPTHF